MLVDKNSKLMMDNARLEAKIDTLQKSFHSYIKDSRQDSDMNMRTINILLRRSSCTAQTLESSFVHDKGHTDSSMDSSHHSTQDKVLHESLDPTPEKEANSFGASGDDWIPEGKDNVEINELVRAARERRGARMGAAHVNSKVIKKTITPIPQWTYPDLEHNKSRRSLPKELMLIQERRRSSFAKGAPRCRSANLRVEFREVESHRSRRMEVGRRKSLTQDSMPGKEHESTPFAFGFAGYKSAVQSGGIESQSSWRRDSVAHEFALIKEKLNTSFARGVARRKPADQFGRYGSLNSERLDRRISKSVTTSRSEDLLVEFGETSRARDLSKSRCS